MKRIYQDDFAEIFDEMNVKRCAFRCIIINDDNKCIALDYDSNMFTILDVALAYQKLVVDNERYKLWGNEYIKSVRKFQRWYDKEYIREFGDEEPIDLPWERV